MKKFILLLICLCIAENCFAEKAVLRGLVVLQNSHGQSVSGAQISAFDANAQTSDSSGRFELVFAANKKAGDKVVLSVQKQGFEVVNRKELDVIIPANPDDVVKIVMCKQGERDKHALQYYEIAKDTINRSYEEQLKLVNEKYEKSLKEKNEAIRTLKAQKEAGLSQAKDLADKFAEVNLDDASELYKEAFALFQKGEVDKAIQVLEDEKMDKLLKTAQEEKRKAQERLAKSEEAVRKSIDNYILKARMCKSRFQFDEAEKNYRKAVEGDSDDFENTFEFSEYLYQQNKQPQAIFLCEKALSLAKVEWETAKAMNSLGILYANSNRYSEAENILKKALEITEKLSKQNSAYLPSLTAPLNNLGLLYQNSNRYVEAEDIFNRVLEITEKLSNQNPDIYLSSLAIPLHNLGELYRNSNRYVEAEKLFNRALEITEKLSKQNPDIYLPKIANILNSLGPLYADNKRYAESEKVFNRALEIREKLSQENPNSYLPYLAMTLNNLGFLYSVSNRYNKAEKAFNRALEIIEKLANQNPKVFEIQLCAALINLGIFQADLFEKESKQAYKIKGLSYAERAISMLSKYPDVPKAQKYMKIAIDLKQKLENAPVK